MTAHLFALFSSYLQILITLHKILHNYPKYDFDTLFESVTKCQCWSKRLLLLLFHLPVDILFGIPMKESGIRRFFIRNRQRVISFAVTLVLDKYNAG